jgi:hypothetical protein
MEGQARSALLVARSARNQQVSPSKILFPLLGAFHRLLNKQRRRVALCFIERPIRLLLSCAEIPEIIGVFLVIYQSA